jgi:outer membrane protein assembly factor BamB
MGAALAANNAWSSFHGVDGRTRRVEQTNQFTTTGEVKWSFTAFGQLGGGCAVTDELVYFGDQSGVLYAVSVETGTTVWTQNLGSSIESDPAVGPGPVVYIGASSGLLYAFNGSTGEQLWGFPMLQAVVVSPIVGSNGLVYLSSSGQAVFAIDAVTGHQAWKYDASEYSEWSGIAIGSNGVVYFSVDWGLVALDGDTGTLVFSFLYGGGLGGTTPSISDDGTVYVGDPEGMYAFNGTTDAILWSQYGSFLSTTPAIGADGTVFVVSNTGVLYALDGTTASERWSYAFNQYALSPAIGSDGTVYISGSQGDLSPGSFMVALDPRTGNPVWQNPVSLFGSLMSPSIGEDGTVYFGAGSTVFAFQAVTPSASPTPSVTPSVTPTSSVTSSISASPSDSPSSSPSATVTPTASSTSSPSPSYSPSVTPSYSPSVTPSASPSWSPSPSVSSVPAALSPDVQGILEITAGVVGGVFVAACVCAILCRCRLRPPSDATRPVCEESASNASLCLFLDWFGGCGGPIRLCCRPWDASLAVSQGLSLAFARLVLQTIGVTIALVAAWFWNLNFLIVACVLSASTACRDLVYLRNALRGTVRPAGGLVCMWLVAGSLRWLGAIGGAVSFFYALETFREESQFPAEVTVDSFYAGAAAMGLGMIMMVCVLQTMRQRVQDNSGSTTEPLLVMTEMPSPMQAVPVPPPAVIRARFSMNQLPEPPAASRGYSGDFAL